MSLHFLSPCACNVLRHVCDVLYIYRYTCVCIYIHITKIVYYTYIILQYCTYSWLFTLPSVYYLSVIYVIYQIISTISLQIFKFKISFTSFVFANCFTQTFNILSLNSTSNNAASSPIKCHSWQSRNICWYATYDTLLSYIHITLHFTAQYYTAHILHSSMIFVLPPSRLWTSALNLGLVHISCLVIIHE